LGMKLKTIQVLVKLPSRLLERMDEIVRDEGYTSRQEFIREAVREKVRSIGSLEVVEEEIHARRRKVRAEKFEITPPPRSSLQRGVRREANRF